MINKFWKVFIQGLLSVFKFFPNQKYRVKDTEIDQYFVRVTHHINNAYEKARNEQN